MRAPEQLPKKTPSDEGGNEKPRRINRRVFLLKGALNTAAAATIGAVGYNVLFGKDNAATIPEPPVPEPIPEPKPEKLPELLSMPRDLDRLRVSRGMRRILSEQLKSSGKVTINREVIQTVYRDWLDSFLWGPDRGRVTTSFRNIGIRDGETNSPQREHLESIFALRGVPKEFMWVGAVESNFNSSLRSRVGARGPYQFMPDTAIDYKLLVKNPDGSVVRDLRENLDASAAACAAYLNHERGILLRRELPQPSPSSDILSPLSSTRSGELWRFTLGIYNGSFPRRYRDIITTQPLRPISIDGYFSWVQGEMNRAITEVNEGFEYTVQRGDTLAKILRRYGKTLFLKESEILAVNPSLNTKSRLSVGKKIRIPGLNTRTLQTPLNDTLENIARRIASPNPAIPIEKDHERLAGLIDKIKTANPQIPNWEAAAAGPATITLNVPKDSPMFQGFAERMRMRRLAPYIENLDYAEKVLAFARAVRELDNRLVHKKRAAEQQ